MNHVVSIVAKGTSSSKCGSNSFCKNSRYDAPASLSIDPPVFPPKRLVKIVADGVVQQHQG
jgi:hypothetical protein